MSTLVISEVFPPATGGSGRWLWEVYRRWEGEVFVLAGECHAAAAFDDDTRLHIRRMPLSFDSWGVFSRAGVKRYWRAFRRISRHVKAEREAGRRVRAIHAGRCLPEGLLALAARVRFGIPYACYVHGEELNTMASSRELSFLARRVFGGAAMLIANSRNTAEVLRRDWRVPSDRVGVVNPGVDTERFRPAPPDETVRRELGWRDRRVILTVGRLQKRKGQHRMIEALEQIREAVPDVLYAVVGDGEERDKLETLVRERGLADHVQFLGSRGDDELIRYYQQCDLFALPNIEVDGDFEGFGMVLLEAQACGKPVIAGRSGGAAETLREGATGLVVDCDNLPALAQTTLMLLLADDQRRCMGQLARQWAAARFDWSHQAMRVQRLCTQCFGEPATLTAAFASRRFIGETTTTTPHRRAA